MKKGNPVARSPRAAVVKNQQHDYTAPDLAAQVIAQKFALSPAVAALVAALAGLGPREVRA